MEEEYNLEISATEIEKIFKEVAKKFGQASKYKAEITRLIKAGNRNVNTIISKVKAKYNIK